MSNVPTISPELMERVDAGVDWLDENLPNWRSCVDPTILDMRQGDLCVLGQCWKSSHPKSVTPFSDAHKTYFKRDWSRTDALGFSNWDYYELNAAWQQKFIELDLLDAVDAVDAVDDNASETES